MIFKPGQVVFVMHNDSTLSKIIARSMGSQWSHSAVVYGSHRGKTLLCETSDVQVNLNYLERYIADPMCSVEVLEKSDLVLSDTFYTTCENMLGQMYGYLQLLSLGIRLLFKRKVKNFIRSGLVCCHVIGYSLGEAEGSGINGVDPESFDTEELYQMLKKAGWTTVFKK